MKIIMDDSTPVLYLLHDFTNDTLLGFNNKTERTEYRCRLADSLSEGTGKEGWIKAYDEIEVFEINIYCDPFGCHGADVDFDD